MSGKISNKTMASSKKLQLKLMVDKNYKKVIFAESDKDFVDFLFSFLTMPIGNVIHLLGGKSSIGSMDMLYESVKNLDEGYFNTKACKSMLLNPINSSRSHYAELILRVDSDDPDGLYQCKKSECATKLFPFFSLSPDAKCGCGEFMSLSSHFDEDKVWKGPQGDGIFVKGDNKYIISDDMKVMSTSLTAIQNILDMLKIKNMDDIEESHIDLDKYLLLDLLKRTLISKSPLSGVYFQDPIATSDSEFISQLLPKLEMGLTDESKSLAAFILCKSSKDVLYAESKGEELVDLLLSFLTYPLGSIVKLLEECSFLGCIDNLYRSIDANFVKPEIQLKLLNPELASFFGCSTSLSLLDEMPADNGRTTGCSVCHIDNIATAGTNECKHGVKHITMSEMNPKLASPSEDRGGGYAKVGVKFMITDDLKLSPCSALGIMHTIKKRKFIAANLEEKVIKIGEKEALHLLKACLTSKTPLSDVFGAQKNVQGACKKGGSLNKRG